MNWMPRRSILPGPRVCLAFSFVAVLACTEVRAQAPADTTLARAYAAYRRGNRPRAEELLGQAALRSRGDSALAALLGGMIAWSSGDDRAAHDRFLRALSLDPAIRLDVNEPEAMQLVLGQARQPGADFVRDPLVGGGARARTPADMGGGAPECNNGRIRTGRAAAIGGLYVAGWAAAVALRPAEWWKGPVRSFRFNWAEGGSPAANQDILLHVGASYQASQAAALAWRWACANPMTAAWLGAATAFAVGLPKKIVDGFHSAGFEVKKNLGNAVGALLPVVHARWPATRVVELKGYYFPSDEYRNRAPPQVSPSSPLTDYTGMRFYASINPARGGIGPDWWPKWLGVAVGHGTTPWVTEWPGTHVWYGALDIEWRGMPVRARWWRPVATMLDQVHFPAPGVKIERGNLSVGLF